MPIYMFTLPGFLARRFYLIGGLSGQDYARALGVVSNHCDRSLRLVMKQTVAFELAFGHERDGPF